MAAMRDRGAFNALREEWLTGSSVAFIKKYRCGAGTATKYLGPRPLIGTKAHPKTGARLATLESTNAKRYAMAREREIAILRKPWETKLAETKRMEAESRKLYEGEMYPEGAPLRAVGL